MRLKGKRAIITGGTGMIGRTIADFFIREGCHVLLSGRSIEKLNSIKKEFNSSLLEVFPADVSEIKDVQKLIQEAGRIFPAIDSLVTAAGVYGEIGSLEQCDAERWFDAIKTNLLGTMYSVKLALPLLKQGVHPKIITFAGGGECPLENFSAYASSKGAVLRFTETVAHELKNVGISINAISPGLVNSGFVENLIKAGSDRAGRQKYEEALQQVAGTGSVVSPEKAAALAVFLASEESNGLTGKNISAVWDNWQEITKHIKEIQNSDIYNWRRVKPKDRGYDW